MPRVHTRSCIPAIAIGLLLAPTFVSRALAQSAGTPIAAKSTDLAGFIRDTDDLSKRIAASDASGARDIVASLPPAWRVRHGADEFNVTTDWIAAPLHQAAARPGEWTKTRTTVAARVEAVHREALDLQEDEQEPDDGTALTPAAARAALRDVLARRELKQRDDARLSNSMRQRIQQWLAELFQRLPISRNAATTFSRVFAWVVALGALAALATYLYRARLPRRTLTALAIEVPRATSAEWAARAYAALRAGDAREAMHCGYHAILFRLEEQGVWRVDDSRTPREYVHLLPAHDARRAAFIDLTRRFEQTWYGSRAADGPGLLSHLEAFGCAAPSKPAI